MKILQRNEGIQISDYLVIIIKRDAEKLAVLWRTVTTGAKMPQAMLAVGWRMLPAKWEPDFIPPNPSPSTEAWHPYFPGSAALSERGDKANKV